MDWMNSVVPGVLGLAMWVVTLWYLFRRIKSVYVRVLQTLQPGNLLGGVNPFLCRSEGMRRLSIACIVVGSMTWFGFIAVISNGFIGLNTAGWMIALGGPPALYIIAMVIRLALLWVMDGFKKH